ncbi:uncharacterized protein LOC143154082 [Ptiloglossa arizonensis]|uniref:uncharacterized protein LOC143154082 n=1 Tax=Ptiloglossa arizonensis TaxID=3350558 RepID=UPI003F9F32CB
MTMTSAVDEVVVGVAATEGRGHQSSQRRLFGSPATKAVEPRGAYVSKITNLSDNSKIRRRFVNEREPDKYTKDCSFFKCLLSVGKKIFQAQNRTRYIGDEWYKTLAYKVYDNARKIKLRMN